MMYNVLHTNGNNLIIYARTDDDGLVRVTCIAENPEFQQWLRDNADNLPADIQAKVEAGELTIQEADS
jgi:hypothetical protein